jgi:hypothetical protein
MLLFLVVVPWKGFTVKVLIFLLFFVYEACKIPLTRMLSGMGGVCRALKGIKGRVHVGLVHRTSRKRCFQHIGFGVRFVVLIKKTLSNVF